MRFSSRIRPRYFVFEKILVFCPLILKILCKIFGKNFALVLNRTSSVLVELRDILFAISHSAMFLRSWIIFLLICFKDLLESKAFVPSAK